MGLLGERGVANSFVSSKERKNDIIYTPKAFVDKALKTIPFVVDDKVLDPFYGKGVWYDNYPEFVKKDFTEIQPPYQKDFFEYEDKVDWCVSNPPFSKLNEVLDHTLKISQKGFAYVMASHNITVKRMQKIKDAGFGLTGFAYFFVKDWFGFPCVFLIFEKDKDSILLFDVESYTLEQ